MLANQRTDCQEKRNTNGANGENECDYASR